MIEVRDLKKYFPLQSTLLGQGGGQVKAVDGVSFSVGSAETFGLVGESGSGKTTVGRVILRLLPATFGKVMFNGTDVFGLKKREMREMRKKMQIVFQDPYGSLNPRMTVEEIVSEGLCIHEKTGRKEIREKTIEILRTVGLSDDYLDRFPHEFSGGQRQRIGIARAISLNPEFIVCDEPVSALDVSIQAQIINLLMDLQEKFGISYLFISHDLSVVKHISSRIGVMFTGRIVETAGRKELFSDPLHPYTRELLSAIPSLEPGRPTHGQGQERLMAPVKGCSYCDRCPCRMPECSEQEPEFIEISKDHWVSCFAVKR